MKYNKIPHHRIKPLLLHRFMVMLLRVRGHFIHTLKEQARWLRCPNVCTNFSKSPPPSLFMEFLWQIQAKPSSCLELPPVAAVAARATGRERVTERHRTRVNSDEHAAKHGARSGRGAAAGEE